MLFLGGLVVLLLGLYAKAHYGPVNERCQISP